MKCIMGMCARFGQHNRRDRRRAHDLIGRTTEEIVDLGITLVPEGAPPLPTTDGRGKSAARAIPAHRARAIAAQPRSSTNLPGAARASSPARRQTCRAGNSRCWRWPATDVRARILLIDEPSSGSPPFCQAHDRQDPGAEGAVRADRLDWAEQISPAVRSPIVAMSSCTARSAFEGRSTDELNNNELVRKFYWGCRRALAWSARGMPAIHSASLFRVAKCETSRAISENLSESSFIEASPPWHAAEEDPVAAMRQRFGFGKNIKFCYRWCLAVPPRSSPAPVFQRARRALSQARPVGRSARRSRSAAEPMRALSAFWRATGRIATSRLRNAVVEGPDMEPTMIAAGGKWRRPVERVSRIKSPSWASTRRHRLGHIRLAAVPSEFASASRPLNTQPSPQVPRRTTTRSSPGSSFAAAPDPAADDISFVFQALDVVEVGVVEHHAQLGDLLFYFTEIVQPVSCLRRARPGGGPRPGRSGRACLA